MDFSLVRTRLPKHLQDPGAHNYAGENYTVFDFETTTYGKGLAVYPQNTTVMVAWYNGPGHNRPGWHVSWGGELDHQELIDDCHSADFVVAHNAKFDLQWLGRCGAEVADLLVWDTQIGDYVLGGNRWQFAKLSLENCAKRRKWPGKVGIVSRMIKRGVPTEDIPRSWLERYCKQDVNLTRKLFQCQRSIDLSPALQEIVFTRCIATPVLCLMEFTGMYLDEERVTSRARELERRYGELQTKMDLVTGGINVNSGKQLGEYLYTTLGFRERTNRRGEPDRTPKGAPKTDITTVLSLKARNKRQREFLELYKELNAVYTELTKYLRKFDSCCKESGGHLLAQFNQTNTQTHRLSSNGLDYSTQFQNFPRAYKPMFRARHEGWLVGECDGAQLEFRAATHLGRDPQGLRDIEDSVDVHSFTAETLTQAGQPTDRQGAKAHTFKPLYGGQSGTEAEQTYYRAFKEKYEGIASAQRQWIDQVLRDGYLTTEWGLKFYWPDTRMDRSGYVTNTTSICNYPVQSFATAEIIPIGLVYFWHIARAAGLELLVVNTIHDSIICEVPPDEVDVFHELSQYALIDIPYWYLREVYDVELVVPLGAGVATGLRWADEHAKANEVTYNADRALYAQGEE